MKGSSGAPLVRVPLIEDHELPNQAVNALDEEEAFPHEVFCTCVPRPGWILANPIAAWFPTADFDGFIEWWTGARTPLLEPQAGPPVGPDAGGQVSPE